MYVCMYVYQLLSVICMYISITVCLASMPDDEISMADDEISMVDLRPKGPRLRLGYLWVGMLIIVTLFSLVQQRT